MLSRQRLKENLSRNIWNENFRFYLVRSEYDLLLKKFLSAIIDKYFLFNDLKNL